MELARTLAGVPARLSSRCALCLTVCCALAAGTVRAYPVGAEVPLKVAELSRKLQASRTSSNFRALEAHADSVAGAERDLALYAIGLARHRARQFPQAEKAFAAIGASGGWLGEHAAYYRARCIVLADDFERALGPLERFEEEHPTSHFAPAAARLRVESLMRLRRLDRARSIVARTPSLLEEPVRLYLAGRIEHLDGRRQQAVKLYREAVLPLSLQRPGGRRRGAAGQAARPAGRGVPRRPSRLAAGPRREALRGGTVFPGLR